MFSSLMAPLFCTTIAYPQFQSAIPNGANILVDGASWPAVGHLRSSGGGRRNPFGEAFAAAGLQWTAELCAADSDEDGFSNGEELGDPQCIWQVGETAPQVATGHPGIDEHSGGNGESSSGPDRCAFLENDEAGKVVDTLAMDRYVVPPDRTSYVCKRFRVSFPTRRHIVRVRATVDQLSIDPVIMHHMLLFACPAAASIGDAWRCDNGMPEGCTDLQYAWAFGGKELCLPTEAGLPMRDGDQDYVIQFHYDNPALASGIEDSSGIEIVHTGELRPHDAGWLHTGLAYFSVPPGQSSHCMQTTCIPSAPRTLGVGPPELPWTGTVQSFAHFEHMHTIGKEMYLEQYRDGTKIRDLIQNRHFDFNAQEIVDTDEVEVRHNDELRLSCVMDSSARTAYTFNGESTLDEMCFGYLLYYPSGGSSLLCVDVTETPCEVDDGSDQVRATPPLYVGEDRCMYDDLLEQCGLIHPVASINPLILTQSSMCSSHCCHALVAQLNTPAFASCDAADMASLAMIEGNFLAGICDRIMGILVHENRSLLLSAALCDNRTVSLPASQNLVLDAEQSTNSVSDGEGSTESDTSVACLKSYSGVFASTIVAHLLLGVL